MRIHTFDSAGISHVYIVHDSQSGLISFVNRGRPSKENTYKKLYCPSNVETEIQGIREELKVRDDTKILLLLSLATDEMIRLVSMFPECWYHDVTGGTNRQKRDLFKMAIRTPIKKTFPGNLTVIPSGRTWVFLCLFKIAFVPLYGTVTCSRNRLSLFDEDECSYKPMDTLSKTTPEFGGSRVSLCIFHGLWQPFKEKVFPKLPRKSKGSKLLSDIGTVWGE